MSILHILTVAGITLGWLPTSASASTIGVRSRLITRQFNEFGSSGLFLTPIEKAIFGLCILFAFLTLVQMGCAFLMLLIRRRPESDYRGRVPFLGTIFFSLFWLFISFVLAAITNTQLEVRTIVLPVGVYFASSFAELASPVFMYAGLIFLLFQRESVETFSGMPKGSNIMGLIARLAASVLLFVMLATAIIYEAILSHIVDPTSPLFDAADGIFYLCLAVSEVLTVFIVAASVFLWKKQNPQTSSPALNRFDSNVINPILMIICPLLVIRALFNLAIQIAIAHPSFASRIGFTRVILGDVIVEGTTRFLIFTAALFLGFSLGLTRRQY